MILRVPSIRIEFWPFWGWSVSQDFCSLGSFHEWLTATVIYAWWGWSNWGPVACVSPELEWEAETGMWQSLTSTSPDSHGCTALDMPVKGNDWADGLVLWSSHHMWFESWKIWSVWEFFFVRSLRRYKRAQSQGQHAIDHPGGGRGCRKRNCSAIFFERLKKAINNQTDIRTVLEATQGNFWEMRWSTYGLSWVHKYRIELN